MATNNLILPSGSSGGRGSSASYIKWWSGQLRAALQEANLTLNQRNNINQLVEQEVKRVFIDGKANPQDRLDMWRSRRRDDRTREVLGEVAMMTEQRRHEVLDAYYSLMATKIPPGYSPSMEERMVVDRIASTLRGLEDMAGILGFAQEMGDRMARNHYLQQAQQQAAEEARLASRNSIKPKLP